MRLRCCWLGVFFGPAAAGQVATFEPLGVIGAPWATLVAPNSTATGVSRDGMTVTGWADVWDETNSFEVGYNLTWDPGSGWTAWDTGGTLAVSADGRTTAGWIAGPVPLSNYPFFARDGLPIATGIPTTHYGLFHALSADGLIAAGSWGTDAIRWTQSGGMTALGHIPGWHGSAIAYGMSADGAVIVGADAQGGPNQEQAFIWTAAIGIQGLGFYPGNGTGSRATAVSADGRWVVGWSFDNAGRRSPFFWRAGQGMRLLPLLSGYVDGTAMAVSGDGSVIVGQEQADQLLGAYYWDRARGRRDFKSFLLSMGAAGLEGWTLQYISAISVDGAYLVGGGVDPQGYREGWRARIPAFCYANCDGSTAVPVLTVNDFTCFLNRFAAGDPYTNCDNSTVPPGLNVADFVCFLNHFAQGCP